ncbi:PASTA domain-containing protein [Pseudoxanthomonas beigongshangi]
MAVRYMNSAGRAALQLGRGIDTTTGTPLGVAIQPEAGQVDPHNSGQTVSYDVTIIETSEELEESLGLSIGAEMRYGLFSASGKFEMSEKTQYKSFATYLLAKCEVRNPPVGMYDPKGKPAAADIVNIEDRFRRAYGDAFVRSALTGGEFYIIIEIVHTDTNVQKSMAASLQAEYNGFLVSGGVDFNLSEDMRHRMSSAQTRIIQYQASGSGVTCSLVNDVAGALNRLKAFPQIALDNPVAIQVELASYDTIPELQGNPWTRANLRERLDDCARKRARYKQVVDELDFFLTSDNRQYFSDPPADEDARAWKASYASALNKVMSHAEGLAEGGIDTGFEEAADLPTVRLKRIIAPPEATIVQVPDLTHTPLAAAQSHLAALGLVAQPNSRSVPEADVATPRMQVLGQAPAPQTPVAKGSSVRLDYAVTRSKWLKPLLEIDRVRLVNRVHFAQ